MSIEKEPKKIEFKGQSYFDDRIYVLYLCKGTVRVEIDPDGVAETILYHEQAPADYIWCVVTYRNCVRYPLANVKHFFEKDDAISYMRKIEPETPLISLSGYSPFPPASYEEYLSWKNNNNFREYDYQKMYMPGGSNPTEIIIQTKEQFTGIT